MELLLYIFSFEIGESLFHQKNIHNFGLNCLCGFAGGQRTCLGRVFSQGEGESCKKERTKEGKRDKEGAGKRPYNMNLTIIFLIS